MNTYTILTNGIQTHRLVAGELPTSTSAFTRVSKTLTGPMATSGKIVAVVGVDERARKKLGARCPDMGQEFPSLADAARFMGANVQSLYCSRRGEKREAGCYGIWGVQLGYVDVKS